MKKMEGEPFKPGPRSLFKTIQGFMKFAHIRRMERIHITRWLLHKDIFLKMKEEMKKEKMKC